MTLISNTQYPSPGWDLIIAIETHNTNSWAHENIQDDISQLNYQLNLTNWNVTNKADQVTTYTKTETNNLLNTKENTVNKWVANWYASLDLNWKIPNSQINDVILWQLYYMWVYDFSSWLPTATEKGQYWICSIAWNWYEVGDWAAYNWTTFDKVDNTDAVSSVAGRTWNVVLTKTDVWLANVDNTTDLNKPISTLTQTALDWKANQSTTYTKTETNNLLDWRVAKISSTDNAITRFDWTTWEIQNSSVIIDDNWNLNANSISTSIGYGRILTKSGTTDLHSMRVLNIPYIGGESGSFTFDPVLIFGLNHQGGSVRFEVNSREMKHSFGYIQWRNNGDAGAPLSTGVIQYILLDNNGVTISVSTITDSNTIKVDIDGVHTGEHGWQCRIIA